MKSIPKYAQVRQSIHRQIQEGKLKPNDKLLSEDEYAKLYGVSTITVRKALSELVTDGYITRTKNKGTFVREQREDPASSKLVAFLMSPEDYYDVSYMQIIKGAQKILSQNGYSLIVEWTDKRGESEQAAIQKMLDQQVAGLFIYPFDPARSRENYRLIQAADVPYVQIDRYDIDAPGYFVGCDNYGGGLLATRKLIEMGHRRIYFGAYQFFLSSELERFDGYASAMRQANIRMEDGWLLNGIDYDELYKKIQARELTALFCCNDKLAIKVIHRLMEYGVQIPEDVSIMGFDDWAGRNLPMGLTTVRQNFADIGQSAGHLLLSVMNGSIRGGSLKLLTGVSVVMRDTVGPCRP